MNLHDLYYSHVHPLQLALNEASRRGVLWDLEAASAMKRDLLGDLEETRALLSEELGEEFNPASAKQTKQLLYEKKGFPVIYHHKTRQPTTDEDALLRLQNKYPNELVLDLIIRYRKHSKLISTFIDVKLDEDGRVRCSYNASGTKTGRISSSKNIFGGGMNLQNVPKGYTPGVPSTRHLYRAADGNIFVVGDLKQAEAMVVAWILRALGDPTLFDLYHEEGFDIHRWCAAYFVYLKNEEAVTSQERQQGGKLANHSGNYMAGPRVMETRARKEGYKGFSFRFCKEILQRRKRGIPGLQAWWNKVEREVKASRMLTTCWGRHLHFFDRIEGQELRSAVAFEPQSTVGDVTNKMFIDLSWRDHYWPVLTTHDEIVLEGPEGARDEMIEALRSASRIPLALRPGLEELIIPIEIGVGKNWRDLEEVA